MTRTNRSIMSLVGIGALALTVASVQAEPSYRGNTNNELTKKEQRKLAKQREHINDMRDRALRDGRVTRKPDEI